MVKRLTVFVVVLGLIVTLGVTVRSQSEPSSVKTYVYSAKFTCGTQSGSDDDVVQGIYRTNINIHNPTAGTVNFRTKVVIPDNAGGGLITPLVGQSLASDHALFIDCFTGEPQSIQSQLTAAGDTVPSGEFEGFVVIESQVGRTQANPILDVVAKYTARPSAPEYVCDTCTAATAVGNVSSLQIVPVTADIAFLPPFGG